MSGVYWEPAGEEIRALAGDVLGRKPLAVQRFCDSDGEYQRKYNVYLVSAGGREYVLKKSSPREAELYEKYLPGLPAPACLGRARHNGAHWLLLEYVPGPDLRHFNREMALAAAESLAQVQNAFWGTDQDPERFLRYQSRIEKRAQCLAGEPELAAAYRVFLDRQRECPRTLCHGDFLQLNGVFCQGRALLIDWAFGGVMPYSLDIARLIAHGNPSGEPGGFPFYMDRPLRELFVGRVYEKLEHKPDWEQYCLDIRLAVLNEYVEFLEGDLLDPDLDRRELEAGYYYRRARRTAESILKPQ